MQNGMNSRFFLNAALLQRLPPRPRWPVLIYATTWTTILTVTVAVASFIPEMAFVSAVSPTSSSLPENYGCGRGGVRLPLNIPSDQNLCFPALLFKRSKMDMVVPPIFAAAIVASSAFLVNAIGLWESQHD